LGDQALLSDAAADEDIFCGDVAQDWFAEMEYDLGVGD
jgi:hypothetical protein